MNLPVGIADMQSVARNGSPDLMAAAGRAFGLGAGERQALLAGKIPWWTMLLGGIAIGFVAGAQVHGRWPDKLPGWIAGRS